MFANKHIVLCIVLFFSVSIKAQESVVKIPKKAALYSAIIPEFIPIIDKENFEKNKYNS